MQRHKPRRISQCLELAILLEASAHKPGNVSLVTDFENTRFEHFLASSVAAAPAFEVAADRGIAAGETRMSVPEIGLGQLIKDCAAEVDAWQQGGNTLLGTIILLLPIAAAAGMTTVGKTINLRHLRRRLKLIVESTTAGDAVNLYQAIKIARPGGLGKAPDLDINDPESEARILEENVSLFEVFKIAEKYDTVCSEWVNNYPVTFDMAYPSLVKEFGNGKDLNEAIIHTFLKVLANVPDTFIARKVGIERSRKVSVTAQKVLELGGLNTASGTRLLQRFDDQLRRSGNFLNPGTTADIVSAALSICVLSGYRP